MSEYIEIETNFTDNPDVILISTNLTLAEAGEESYQSREDMEEGSPLAQTLALIEGIIQLRIYDKGLEIRRNPADDWYYIVPEISTALKDFFL